MNFVLRIHIKEGFFENNIKSVSFVVLVIILFFFLKVMIFLGSSTCRLDIDFWYSLNTEMSRYLMMDNSFTPCLSYRKVENFIL